MEVAGEAVGQAEDAVAVLFDELGPGRHIPGAGVESRGAREVLGGLGNGFALGDRTLGGHGARGIGGADRVVGRGGVIGCAGPEARSWGTVFSHGEYPALIAWGSIDLNLIVQ